MKKLLLHSLLVSIIVTLVAGVAMFFIPLPGGDSSSNPDAITETSYGFPMTFKTTESGGFAGNLPGDSTINPTSLVIDAGIIAAVVFVISFGAMSLATQSKKQ